MIGASAGDVAAGVAGGGAFVFLLLVTYRRLREHETRLGDLAERVSKLEGWRNGRRDRRPDSAE